MPHVLIVAYGNPLRCDDGVAWRAAEALEGKFAETEVELLRLHQLVPETAEAARHRSLILFLDAACLDQIECGTPGQIRVKQISQSVIEKGHAEQFSHIYSPSKVLHLARELYDSSPKALVITVTGENFGHGDRLSDPVAAAVPSLVATVEQVVRKHNSSLPGES
jgi:hydrogenase maturation protease